MKKSAVILALVLAVLSLFGCGKKELKSEDIPAKEYEDYDDFSNKSYSLKYDDNKFKHEEIDGVDVFTLVGSDDEDTYVKIKTHENASMNEIVNEYKKAYVNKGLSDISYSQTNYFNVEGTMDISAYGVNGERVYETLAVIHGSDIITISYAYSTDLSQTSVGNAIDGLVHSFTLK